MMTYKDSVALAHRLRELSPAILGVELFGSVLSKGRGRDADFMILVDNRLAKDWWTKERESIRVRWPDALYKLRWIIKTLVPFAYSVTVYKRRSRRLKGSLGILGIGSEALINPIGQMPNFEMFLVPPKWRIGTEVNMNLMGGVTDLVHDRNTLGLLRRVAKTATLVA